MGKPGLPFSSHTEEGEMIETPVSQCPPRDPGHMTSVQCRIRTIGIHVMAKVKRIKTGVAYKIQILSKGRKQLGYCKDGKY